MTMTIATTAATQPSAWRRCGVALVALLVATLLLYRDTALDMVAVWSRSETFAHAFLVPPIVLWLVWRKRGALAALQPAPALSALPLLGLAAAAWLLGELASVNVVKQFALVTMLAAAVPLAAGWQVARCLAFALAFMYFAVPTGEFMVPRLMEWTADFTVMALHATGIPVFREGLDFVIPSGNWSVAEACSGVRYLIASFMVGVLYAYINYRSLRRRLVFVALSLLVPIVANWLRAYIIVMLGHLSDNRIATGVDHLIYGWVFFGVVMMLLYWIGARWSEYDSPATPVAARHAGAGVARPPQPWLGALITVALLALPQAAVTMVTHAERPGTPLLELPGALADDWQQARGSDWSPLYVGAAAQARRSYASPTRSNGAVVDVEIFYYRHQREGSKLVGSDNALVRRAYDSWTDVDTRIAQVRLADGDRTLPVQRTLLRRSPNASLHDDSTLTVWRSYWIDDTLVADDIKAKLHAALGRLAGRGDDGAAIVLSVQLPAADAGRADRILEAFVQDNLGQIEAALRRTRDR